jgi:hypothetical protein
MFIEFWRKEIETEAREMDSALIPDGTINVGSLLTLILIYMIEYRLRSQATDQVLFPPL